MEKRKDKVETFILSTKGEEAGVLLRAALWRRKGKIIVMGRDRAVSDDDRFWQA